MLNLIYTHILKGWATSRQFLVAIVLHAMVSDSFWEIGNFMMWLLVSHI